MKQYDIIGTQEVKFHQGNALSCLTNYKWVGEGRESYGNDINIFFHFIIPWIIITISFNLILAWSVEKCLKTAGKYRVANSLLDLLAKTYSAVYFSDVYPTRLPVKVCSKLVMNYWAGWAAVAAQYFCSGRYDDNNNEERSDEEHYGRSIILTRRRL